MGHVDQIHHSNLVPEERRPFSGLLLRKSRKALCSELVPNERVYLLVGEAEPRSSYMKMNLPSPCVNLHINLIQPPLSLLHSHYLNGWGPLPRLLSSR